MRTTKAARRWPHSSSGTPISAASSMPGCSASSSSTSRGKTFSAPETIISSSRPSTCSRPWWSKWPTSPRGHQAVDDLLGAAARVALEREAVVDEDAARLARAAARVPCSSRILHARARRRRADAAGLDGQLLRRGDRRVGDLRRAVEVVDDGAERLREVAAQLGAELRAAAEEDLQAREVALAEVVEREHAAHHHRDDDGRVGLREVVGERLRLELAPQPQRRAHARRSSAIAAKPSAWKIGAPMATVWRGAERDLAQQRADLDQRLGLGARGALRRPGRAAGEDDHARVLGGLGRGARVAAASVRERARARARRSRGAPRSVASTHLEVLLVADQHLACPRARRPRGSAGRRSPC